MGMTTEENRRSCPSPGWRRTSNRVGSWSRSCRTNGWSSGFPVEKDEPHRHLGQEFVERQDVPFGHDHVAERMAVRELGEDEVLQSPDREGVRDRDAATGFAR